MKAQGFAPGTMMIAAASAALLTAKTASAQPMHYFGGRVISNVEVVEVAWTKGVDPNFLTQLEGFYKAIVQSEFIDWMTEYDTIGQVGKADGLPGSNQHIGRGTFGGTFTISPANMKTTLQDSEIQAELAAQLTSGALPPPKLDANGNVNTLYMFDFPAGYTIVLFGAQSCQQFGGYHFSITYNGKSVPYGVHPRCGNNFQSATVIHSHELAEAITDTEQGQAMQFAPQARPVGWMTAANTTWEALENADLCQGSADFVAGYLVTGVWSNFANGCVTHIPICDGTTMPPKCRPCNQFDSGNACSGPKPACATAGPETGHCVPCTSAYPNACTGATPACDDAKNTCVGCVTSADCKAPGTPVCDTSTQTCRACQANTECSTGVCDLLDDAQRGQCVQCNADNDCGADARCENHACLPNGSGGGGGGSFDVNEGGCACRTAPLGDGKGGLWLAVGLFATAAARRRRSSPPTAERGSASRTAGSRGLR